MYDYIENQYIIRIYVVMIAYVVNSKKLYFRALNTSFSNEKTAVWRNSIS